MSQTLPVNATPSSSSNFQSIFNIAVRAYEKQTKKDLLSHPLACQLQECDTPASVLVVLQAQVDDLGQARKSDERLTKWLGPTINVLLAFSDILGEGVSLVSVKCDTVLGLRFRAAAQMLSPAKVIFAGAGVLLQVGIRLDVSRSPSFELIENLSGG
jgi:hypothetical protein